MWLVAGFVLLVLELATPSGFFIMFFGVGAILTGVLASVGALTSLAAQWFAFTVASVLTLLLFRGKIQARVEATGRGPGGLAGRRDRDAAGRDRPRRGRPGDAARLDLGSPQRQ